MPNRRLDSTSLRFSPQFRFHHQRRLHLSPTPCESRSIALSLLSTSLARIFSQNCIVLTGEVHAILCLLFSPCIRSCVWALCFNFLHVPTAARCQVLLHLLQFPMKAAKKRRDWTDLPATAVTIISEKACSTNLQYVGLRMVCKAWWRTLTPHPQHLRQGPWLLLPQLPNDVSCHTGIDNSVLSFYDLFTAQTHQFQLPYISGKYICGSSSGWLALEHDHRVTLLNPITKSSIDLPSFDRTILRIATSKRKRSVHSNQHEQYNNCVYKVTFSCNPSERGCIVVAWFISVPVWNLGFCKIGDAHWTGLKKWEDWDSSVSDFIWHNNMVYTVNRRKEVSVYDIQDRRRSVRKFPSKIYFDGLRERVMLVEGGAVSSEPLVVISSEHNLKNKVVVFKWIDDWQEWCQVCNIGKRVVFLDWLRSISLHSINLQLERESEIYYDVRRRLNIETYQVGINRVNLESGTDIPHKPGPLEVFSSSSGLAMWFMPSLI